MKSKLFASLSLVFALSLFRCDQDTEFTVVWTGDDEMPENLELCFSDEYGECELDDDGNYLSSKIVTFNTCNLQTVVRVKAMGDGIDENTELSFYLRGVAFYGDDLDDGVCARQDIFCYCPTSNVNEEVEIRVIIGERRSNELDLTIKKREDIIETYNFNAEVVFISDYMCNPDQNLQPHINIFDFSKSKWNEDFNDLDADLDSFMPVLFCENENRTFGKDHIYFECSPELFDLEEPEEEGTRWCVAVEDWFCGHSDQDYDYVMTYETESQEDLGKLRLTFRPITHFGALNYHIIKFTFDTDDPRLLKFNINQLDNGGSWFPFEVGEIEIRDYADDGNGGFVYEFMLPAGKLLFKEETAEAIFVLEYPEE